MEEAPKEKSLQDEYLAGWQRERADFLNYKREEMERLKLFLGYATEDILSKLLPIIDNLELAEKELTEEHKNNSFVKGVLQIAGQLKEFLKNQGVQEMDSQGKKFNPEFHEAVGEIEGPSTHSTIRQAHGGEQSRTTSSGQAGSGQGAGMVGEVVAKGYALKGKVLRPAKVKVIK